MDVSLNAIDNMGSLLWTNSLGGSQGFAYAPFGSTSARGDRNSLSPGFNGERLDPVCQTYHLGNGYRSYSPTLMRLPHRTAGVPLAPAG